MNAKSTLKHHLHRQVSVEYGGTTMQMLILSSIVYDLVLGKNNFVNFVIFNETIINVMSNFLPYAPKRFSPRDSPWINKELVNKLRKKNRSYKKYKRHGYRDEDKERLNTFREECLIRLGNEFRNLAPSPKGLLENI